MDMATQEILNTAICGAFDYMDQFELPIGAKRCYTIIFRYAIENREITIPRLAEILPASKNKTRKYIDMLIKAQAINVKIEGGKLYVYQQGLLI